MAPEYVVKRVLHDYMSAVEWAQNSVFHEWARQWASSPLYFSGAYLKTYRAGIVDYRRMASAVCVGVLRAVHNVEVCEFSEDEESCLVLDKQTQRRQATYEYHKGARIHTQDMGEATIVYRMVYDKVSRHWKINEFIQELPADWDKVKASRQIDLPSAMPTTTARDN